MSWCCSIRAVVESALQHEMILAGGGVILALLRLIRCDRGRLLGGGLTQNREAVLTKVKVVTIAARWATGKPSVLPYSLGVGGET